jgi:UDP-glucuronate 4-epimerase
LQGIRAAADYDGAPYDVFNLGESHTISLRELITALEETLGKKAVIEQRTEQPGDMPATWADISKARALLGYDPRTPLEEGLPRFVQWLRERGA